LPSTSIAMALEPPFPAPLPPVPAVLALSEGDCQKGLLPSLPFGIRVSRPHYFATLCLEKIGKVDPVPCPTFQGRKFDRPDVGWFNQK
jgi:hypothetical protein